ncbi:MAG: leucine-rich repeat domain-containing protein [Clostridia bacterium]|nr:leucine-rich repeat domain-containing protein [Clostridia bacterium]
MAFFHCESLESITVPGSVAEIKIGTFYSCFGLKNVIIEEGVQKIELSGFYNCTSLEEITLPKSLTHVGNIFTGCDLLKKIRFNGTVEEWNLLFENVDLPTDCQIICADGTV